MCVVQPCDTCQAQSSKKRGGFNIQYQLRIHSHLYRDGETVMDAWKFSCLFATYAPAWHSMLSDESWQKVLGRFSRAGLDQELREKCAVEKPLRAQDFRFLALYGIDVDPRELMNAEQKMDEAQQNAAAAREAACLNEATLTLQREQTRWRQHAREVELHECQTKGARLEFKAAETLRNKEAAGRYLDLNFPVRELDDGKHILPFVNSCIEAKLQNSDKDASGVYQVWVLNMLVPGNKYLASARVAIAKLADAIAANKERVCGIIYCANVSGHGATYSEEATQKAAGEIEGLLADPDLRIKVRKINFVFDEASLASQSNRQFWHPGWLVVSDVHSRDDAGQLVSEFANSKLYIRGGASQLHALPVKSYVNPLARMTRGGFSGRQSLSIAVRSKQWMAGPLLSSQVLQRLWAGMKVSSANDAVVVDLFPFDSSYSEAIMNLSVTAGAEVAKMPSHFAVQPVWAPVDAGDAKVKDAGELIANHVKEAQCFMLQELLKKKVLTIDGWSESPFHPDGEAPRINAKTFVASCPTHAGSLALRQDWVDGLAPKLGSPSSASWTQFLAIVQEHNDKYNKSGKIFVDGAPAGGKREGEPLGREPAVQAEELPVKEGDPESKPDLIAAGEGKVDYTCIVSQGHELLIGSDGSLWLHGMSEGVLLASVALCQIFGKYVVDKEAEEALSKSTGALPWSMSSPSFLVSGQIAEPMQNGACTSHLQTLDSFVKHIVDGGVMDFSIACHAHEMKFDKTENDAVKMQLQISPKTTCAYVVQPVPPGYSETVQNAGSKLLLHSQLSWDWAEGKHKDGLLKIHPHLSFEKQRTGHSICPLKPGIYLTRNIKIQESMLRRIM